MGKGTKIFWISFSALAIILFLGYHFGTTENLAFIGKNSENVVYQYAGTAPNYKYSKDDRAPGQSNICLADRDVSVNNIIFSNTQQITANGNNYNFIVTGIKQAFVLRNGNPYYPCGSIAYNVSVQKNNAQIDFISVPSILSSCSDLADDKWRITKNYTDIIANFAYAGEFDAGDKLYCDTGTYIVNKYKINQAQSSVMNPSVVANSTSQNISANPANTIYVNPEKTNYLKIITYIIVAFAIIMIAWLLLRRKR